MDTHTLYLAASLIADPLVLIVVVASACYGLFIGCMPGLSATMGTALLVPLTFFLPPIPAIAAIITASAMAIFAGDIPGALLRIPGTPASAAYVAESHALTKQGKGGLALAASLWFSVLGGLLGSAVMISLSQPLAEIAINFSSFEYFWLVVLGLIAAAFVGTSGVVKSLIMLIIGLSISCIGLNNPAGVPRYTFGSVELMGSLGLIPIMVGVFAISEVLRTVVTPMKFEEPIPVRLTSFMRTVWHLTRKFKWNFWRGGLLGTVMGIQPGTGPDMAAYISYSVSKKFSKEPEKYGTGHLEGIVEAGSANNSALSGAWIPTVVFGIPGDTITAIAIGVLFMKGINPGPMVFINNPQDIYAVFMIFILANLLMLPLGWVTIKMAGNILRVPPKVLVPIIVTLCIVGAFAINNSLFDVGVILVFGLFGYLMEENDFPLAPLILGVVLGPMLELNFIASLMKADGDLTLFVTRPIAGGLAAATTLIIVWSVVSAIRNSRRTAQAV